MNTRKEKLIVIGICVVLAAMICAVFGRTLGHEFVNFDDDEYVYENPQVTGGLTWHGIAWAFTHVHSSNWHPVTWLSHMMDCQLYGLNPAGHHLTSLLLHIATTLVLFFVLRKMTRLRTDTARSLWCSAFVAAMFAIHPLRVESVAWISERKDVLSGLFFVLTLLAYTSYTAHRTYKTYLLTLLLFTLGLMSKPMVITLPFVLLLLDYWPLRRVASAGRQPSGEDTAARPSHRSTPTSLLIEKLPLLILCAASCAATLFAQKEALAPMPLSMRLANVPISYVVYLKQMFYPAGLTAYYPHPENSLAPWTVAAAIVLLLILSIGVVASVRKHPWLLIGWLWYLGMLIPVIGLLQVGSQAHADRYTYLPQIGLCLALVWAVAELSERCPRREWILGGSAVMILAGLIVAAHTQIAHWRNSQSLWTHALACTSKNIVAHNNLGGALLRNGDVDGAIAHFQQALEIKSDYPDAHINLGNALLQKGRVNDAIAHYQTALNITPAEAGALFNLGNALLRKGRVGEAISRYRKALEIRPDYGEAHNHLGNALLKTGNIDEAVEQYRLSLQINPGDAKAANNLGYALLQKGDIAAAIVQLQQTTTRNPDNPEAHYNLANAFFRKRDLNSAIVHLQTAVQLDPTRADIHHKLAIAFLEMGRLNQAIAEFQTTLQIEPDSSTAQNDLAWVLATCSEASLRDGSRAMVMARRANQLTGGGNPNVLRTLAAACAEAGQFGDAIHNAQQAIALAQSAGRNESVQEFTTQLKLYESGIPFHGEALRP